MDERLSPMHISLYHSLFQIWNLNRFINPISINRQQILSYCKIGSNHTYYKCLHELEGWGYIIYQPSHSPTKPSFVHVCIFSITENDEDEIQGADSAQQECKINISSDANSAQQECKTDIGGAFSTQHGCKNGIGSGAISTQHGCKTDTGSGAKMHPLINNINRINNTNNKTNEEGEKNSTPPIENTIIFSKNLIQEFTSNKKEKKRRKVAQKEEKEVEYVLPFPTMQFSEAWSQLLEMPKWKNKHHQSLLMVLKKLAKYEELFAIHLIELAIANNWQGLVFSDTDTKYEQWKRTNSNDGNKTLNSRTGCTKNIAPETCQPERNYKERF